MTDSSLLSLSPVDLGNRTIYRDTVFAEKATFLHLPEVEDSPSHLCCFICSTNQSKEGLYGVL